MFRDATKQLGLPALPERALIVSGDLSSMPPKVLTVESDLAGRARALATVPLLARLKASVAAQDAYRAGNVAVAAATSHDLARSLAMMLYCNPFITR